MALLIVAIIQTMLIESSLQENQQEKEKMSLQRIHLKT